MSKPLGFAYIKEGQQSLVAAPGDLFDKIINLKLIRKEGPPIVIRSDYEAVFHNDGGDGKVHFKRCVQKPEIKVTYKQVAQSVAIEVDIRITNFHLDGVDETTGSMFTADGDPVISCIIQMGYRAQFPDFTAPAHQNDGEAFYDLKMSESGNLWRQINVQILTGYRESYPPDSVTCFKGVIGTTEDGLRWTHTDKDLVKYYGDGQFPIEFREVESVLYQFVTRRFVRASVPHVAYNEQTTGNSERINESQDPLAEPSVETIKQKIKIFGHDKYESPGNNAMDRLDASKKMASLSLPYEDAVDLELLESGIMSVDDANKFGVICVCSNTLRSLPAEALTKYKLTPEQAANIGRVPPTPLNWQVESLGGQLAAIQAHYPYLRWFILTDGSFYFYHVRDEEADLWRDDYINHMKEKNALPLPAIYDMTPAGTRTIRCPFISFLSPMTTVMFQSRYNLGTLTSFYYPVKTLSFLVITAAIEFSTTGDENMMELMCVDMPAEEAPEIAPDGSITVPEHEPMETPEVAKMQDERNLKWAAAELTVVLHKTNATETDSSWNNIVKNEIVSRLDRVNYPELAEYNEQKAAEFLRDANPGYFAEGGAYMSRGNSIENDDAGIGGRTGIKVPWLKVGDKIALRIPVRPSFDSGEYYPPDEEMV